VRVLFLYISSSQQPGCWYLSTWYAFVGYIPGGIEMSKRKRDKQPKQPNYRPHNTGRVLPPPPPGFDPDAHIHRTMTNLYNQGVLRYGTPDKIIIVTEMASLEASRRNLEGSVVHSVILLSDITRAEPDYCRRIGLETSPGQGTPVP
jgi:hypothetical protein